jgi:hypothetical protein
LPQGDAAELAAAGVTNAAPASGSEPLTDTIRFLSFRFWDGSAWRDSWSGIAPPPGVEVTLGFEPPSADAPPDVPLGEVFRRVIFVPAGQAKPADTNFVSRLP